MNKGTQGFIPSVHLFLKSVSVCARVCVQEMEASSHTTHSTNGVTHKYSKSQAHT